MKCTRNLKLWHTTIINFDGVAAKRTLKQISNLKIPIPKPTTKFKNQNHNSTQTSESKKKMTKQNI